MALGLSPMKPASAIALSILRISAAALAVVLAPITGHAAAPAAADSKIDAAKSASPDTERFFRSIFKVRVRAVPNARSSATLGQEREGTGVVIGDDGLVVTIGYLIVEADEVSLVDLQGPRASRARRRLRPCDGAGSRARGRAGVRAGVAAGRIREAQRPRSRDDRQSLRRRRRDARASRVDAAVHRQLGIPARAGDIHVAADDELERRGARQPRSQARRHRLFDRARSVFLRRSRRCRATCSSRSTP